MLDEERIQTAKVVRVIDHGNNVQLLCADEWGLLSVYFDTEPFAMFHKFIQKTGMTLTGLQIQFNSDMVRVAGLNKKQGGYVVPRRAMC